MTSAADRSPSTSGLVGWTLDDSLADAAPVLDGHAAPRVGMWAGPPEDPGRYELLEPVGGGAEGITYRAQYRPTPTASPVPVAVKLFLPPAGASARWPLDGSWQRVSQQYRVLSGLRQSVHLVDTREVFLGSVSTEPTHVAPFAVMQWIAGEPPGRVLSRRKVTLRERVRWVQDLAGALQTLRSCSTRERTAVVHGDIKPENCLIDPAGRLVLIDLGAAGPVDSSAPAGLHTPRFAAPEVLAAPGAARTTASDTFSLGATAFALIVGHPPPAADVATFVGDVVDAVVMAPHLRRLGSVRRRRRLAAHLLLLLEADPGGRDRRDPAQWARDLSSFVGSRVVISRVPAAVTAAVLSVGLGVSWGAGIGPFANGADDGNDEGRSKPAVVSWDRLPVDAPLDDPRVETAYTFPRDAAGWPTQLPNADAAVRATAYRLHVTRPEAVTVIPAPVSRGTRHEVVQAHVDIVSGQGAVGVFCRAASDSQRYSFVVTHAGYVGIFSPAPDGKPSWTHGTGFRLLEGVDFRNGVDLQARCDDTAGSVLLSLAVNGRTVLTLKPDYVLGPSTAGLVAFGFAELDGDPVTADVRSFAELSTA